MDAKAFMGANGFVSFVGVVEDRMDPLMLGRVKIRILGKHSEDKALFPTADLPWAYPLQPVVSASISGVGHAPVGPVEGTWVTGYFRDGANAQEPVVLGTIAGKPDEPVNYSIGFSDPFRVYPRYNKPIRSRADGMAIFREIANGWPDDISELVSKLGSISDVFDVISGHVATLEGFALAVLAEPMNVLDSMIAQAQAVFGSINGVIGGVATAAVQAAVEVGSAFSNIACAPLGVTDHLLSDLDTILSPAQSLINFGRSLIYKILGKINDLYSKVYQIIGEVTGEVYNQIECVSGGLKSIMDLLGGFKGLAGKTATGMSNVAQQMASDYLKPLLLGLHPLRNDLPPPAIGEVRHSHAQFKKDTRITRAQTVDGYIEEPETTYSPDYPYNQVFESESGHTTEQDDTLGYERIMVMHRSGTFDETAHDGSRVTKIYGDDWNITLLDDYLIVGGTRNVIIKGDSKILIKGNCIQKVDGNMETSVNGDYKLRVAGDMETYVDGEHKIAFGGDSTVTGQSGSTFHYGSGGDIFRWKDGTSPLEDPIPDHDIDDEVITPPPEELDEKKNVGETTKRVYHDA